MEYAEIELKDLRIRRYVIVPIIILIIALAWTYFAYKFENIIKNQIISNASNNDYIISDNIEGIIIEKFKFRAILPKVTILPKSNFKIYSDSVEIGYNPFNESMFIGFRGDDVKIGNKNNGVLLASSDLQLLFSKDLLEKDFDNIQLQFTAKNFSASLLSDNSKLCTAKEMIIRLSSKLNEDKKSRSTEEEEESYKLDVSLDNKSLQFSLKNIDNYINLLKSYNSGNQEKNNAVNKEKFFKYYEKLEKHIFPINWNTNYAASIKKDQKDNLIAVITGKMHLLEFLLKFNLLTDKYSFFSKGSIDNHYFHSSSMYKFTNDGTFININFNNNISNNYLTKQKKNIVNITSSFAKDYLVKQNEITTGISNLLKMLLEPSIISSNLAGYYGEKGKRAKFLFGTKVDDFNLEINTSLDDKLWEASISINSPGALISGINNLYNDSFKYFFSDTKYLDQFFENVKTNGLSFLAAFHKNNELNSDEELLAKISFTSDFDNIKINNKQSSEILNDDRVINFLKGLDQVLETHQNQ